MAILYAALAPARTIMTLRTYFIDRAVIGAFVLVLFGGGYYLYATAPEPVAPPGSMPLRNNATAFVWQFEPNNASSTPDGFPQTNVFVEVKYPSNIARKIFVETVPMSCNELDEVAMDAVAGSKEMQCYAAGRGYRYKITKGEESYLIQRMAFEEALPDQPAPSHDYHVISEVFY